MSVLTGSVAQVTYRNEETLYTILQLDTAEGPVKVVGALPGVTPGEELAVTGEWEVHPAYGRQFRVQQYRRVAPAGLPGIERYLSSGLVKGVGPALAKRLVAHFGLETLRVIAENPERLAEVPGLGARRRESLQAALAAQQAVQDIMVFLQGLGASPALAARIFRQYGAGAVRVLQQEPYRLADEVWGIGFRTADRLARSLGISADSPERAKAAVLYLLQQASGEGHLFLSLEELARAGAGELQVSPQLCRDAVTQMAMVGRLVVEDDGQAVYLPRLYQVECEVARLLLTLHRTPGLLPAGQEISAPAVAAPPGDAAAGPALSAEQQEAVAAALQGGVTVVTGGPGTGKTTIVRAIVQQAGLAGRRAVLAAPTGRAAKRLAEATGAPASTIHRLLEFAPGGDGGMTFARNAGNPLPADLVIIDEVSMLDIPLAAHLLRAIRPGVPLVLLGDADQLPPVGPGSFLRDVLQAGVVRTVRLTHIFRQAQESMIVVNAHRINAGEMPLLNRQDADFFHIERNSAAEMAQIVQELVVTRLPAYLGCQPLRDIQVLTPIRSGPAGVFELNRMLQAALNPAGAGAAPAASPAARLAPGDRVMQIRNNYSKMVFNGDIGIVQAIDAESGEVAVLYADRDDGRPVVYDSDEWDELELAYAASVHKSQGSEFPVVVMPLVRTAPALMTRNLLYTAVTRAKRLVVLVGSRQTLQSYVANNAAYRRNSRLILRLSDA